MDTTDQNHYFIPPNRVKLVSITVVVWGILTFFLFKIVPICATIFEGFEVQPNSISLIYMAIGRVRSAFYVARFLVAGVGAQVLLIELFVTQRERMTRQHQLLRVAMWLSILMPLWIAVVGCIAIGLDLFFLTRTLD